MEKYIKIEELKLDFPPNFPFPGGYCNWAAINPAHVILGCDSWLVVGFDRGQDNISEESDYYHSPAGYPKKWVVYDYYYLDKAGWALSYKWDVKHCLYSGRELHCRKVLTTEAGTMVFELISFGLGAITPKAQIFIDGVKVPKIYLPEIPDIQDIPGMWFYNNHCGYKKWEV